MSDAVHEPAPTDPMLDALWERARTNWADEKAHAAILEHALRANLLPEVAGRYRALVDDPVRGPVAKKRLDAIVLAATNLLLSTKTPKRGQGVPIQITLSAFGICVALLAWLAFALMGSRFR